MDLSVENRVGKWQKTIRQTWSWGEQPQWMRSWKKTMTVYVDSKSAARVDPFAPYV